MTAVSYVFALIMEPHFVFSLHNTVLTLISCLTSTNNPHKITEDVIMIEFVTCQYFFFSFFLRHNVDIPVISKMAVENSWDILNTIFGHKYH